MKSILFSVLLAASCISISAQNLQILSSKTIVKAGEDRESHVALKNNSSSAIDVKVTRTFNSLASGHASNFCWDICYGPGTSTSVGKVTIQPGAVDSIDFIGDLVVSGNSGTSVVRYQFFDMNNTQDSVGVTFTYVVNMTTGISQKDAKPALQAYPNPADNEVKIVSNLTGAKSPVVEIYNAVGMLVQKAAMDERGMIILPVSHLAPGAYYYTLISEGKTVATKKLIVYHKN